MAETYPIIRLNILNETITFQDADVIEAETIQEIHPVGIEVPASTARMRVYLDDAIFYTTVIVDASGSADVNGKYYPIGTHDNKPLYHKTSGGEVLPYIVWVAAVGAWYISQNSETDNGITKRAYYSSSEDVSVPGLVTTWSVEEEGTAPVPTVTGGHPTSLREKFSPFSDGEYYQAMTAGLVVNVSEYVDGAERAIGRFYLEEWNNPKEGELELVCTDLVGTLENKNFLGNFYETPASVSKIVGDVLAEIDILYEIDSAIASKLLKGYIPGNITLREALQQVLFACGAYALTTGDSKLKIKESIIPEASFTSGDIDVTVTNTEKTDSQTLNILPIVTGVEIMSHDYSKGQTLEEIFSAFLTSGDYMVVYPKPYWHVEGVGVGDTLTYLATTNNEVLVTPDSGVYPTCTIYTLNGEFDFGVNYVYLHVPEPGGTATISGKPWLDATQLFDWKNPVSGKAQPNIWKIDDAKLVPSVQASTEETVADVLARVTAYASLRYQQQVKLFPRTDVDLGNIALVDSLYGKDVVGIVERMSSSLSGGYLIETEIVGAEHTEE